MCEKDYNDIVIILFSLKERTLTVLNTMNEHSQLGKECRTLLHTKTSVLFLDYIVINIMVFFGTNLLMQYPIAKLLCKSCIALETFEQTT